MAISSINDDKKIEIGIIRKAWTDKNYKQRLKTEPIVVCQEARMIIPDKVLTLSKTGGSVIFKLPDTPRDIDVLTVEQQEQRASTLIQGMAEMF